MSHRAFFAALAVTMTSLIADADPARAGDFDRDSAANVLGSVNVQVCKPKGKKAKAAPTGDGHVIVTYGPNGAATGATVDTAPFAGTKVGACIEREFKKTKVPPFDGTPISVGKKFTIQ
jgi:hypothetical protein